MSNRNSTGPLGDGSITLDVLNLGIPTAPARPRRPIPRSVPSPAPARRPAPAPVRKPVPPTRGPALAPATGPAPAPAIGPAFASAAAQISGSPPGPVSGPPTGPAPGPPPGVAPGPPSGPALGPAPPRPSGRSKPRSASWRALSLRWPYLLLLTLLSIALFATIETLRQMSDRHHGLLQLDDSNPSDLPTRTKILYTYVPSVVGVLYSILWSFIDADVKRLEPYVQMRSPQSSAGTLLLDYIFESPFVVPFRALKRRHWFIFAVSTSFLLISLVFPASQGALLGIERLSYAVTLSSFQINRRDTPSTQLQEGEFVDQAKAISVPNGVQLPPWTTSNCSANPFRLEGRPSRRNETWTVETPVFWADPHCRKMEIGSATVINSGFSAEVYQERIDIQLVRQTLVLGNFTSIEPPACDLSISLVIGSSLPGNALKGSLNESFFPIFASFDGYDYGKSTIGINSVIIGLPTAGSYISSVIQANAELSRLSWRDQSSTCPSKPRIAGIVQLAVREDTFEQDPGSNITSDVDMHVAMYACESTYNSAIGNVTVNSEDERILSIDRPIGQQLLTESQFNKTDFERFLDSGDLRSTNFSALNASELKLAKIAYHESLASFVFSNLTFGQDASSASDLLFERDVLARGVEIAYALVFALMTGDALRLPAPTESMQGSIESTPFAIIVNPIFAIISETLLALATLVLLGLLFGYRRRRNIMRSDPDSITAQCCIIADEVQDVGSVELLSPYLDQLSTKNLHEEVASSTLQFSERSDGVRFIASTRRPQRSGSILNKDISNSDPLPFHMTKRGITLATAAIVSIVTALLFLVIWASHVRGFAYQTDSTSFVSQLLWSFVPTIVATCLEVNMVSLHRDLGVLETWVRIRKGNTLARDSMSLRYASKPPAVVLFLSLKRRHFVISLNSFLCMTTSILNIAMAGLFLYSFPDFVQQGSTISQHTTTTLPGQWFGARYDVNQAFSSVRAQLSDNATPPTWTSQDQSFMPVDFTDLNHAFSQFERNIFNVTTPGISSSLNCTAVPNQVAPSHAGPGVFTDEDGVQSLRYQPTTPDTDGDLTCSAPFNYNGTFQSLFFVTMSAINPLNGSQADDISGCENTILIVSIDVPTRLATFHICSASVTVSAFNIIHDRGSVLSYQAAKADPSASSMLKDQTFLLSHYTADFMLQALISQSTSIIEAFNGNTRYDWPGLLMTRLRSTSNTTSIPELADGTWRHVFASWFSIYRDQLLTHRQCVSGGVSPDAVIFQESETVIGILKTDPHIKANSNVCSRDGDPSFASTTGTATYREPRMIPSVPAFAVSISLLTLYLFAFAFIVAQRRHRYAGPRMPKTIGSIIPWVIQSRMLDDFRGKNCLSNHDRDVALGQLGRRYGFRRFRGKDGKIRLGIEYSGLLIAKGAYGDF